jgi:hypothetical protein
MGDLWTIAMCALDLTMEALPNTLETLQLLLPHSKPIGIHAQSTQSEHQISTPASQNVVRRFAWPSCSPVRGKLALPSR